MEKIVVDKKGAAIRQAKVALELYFNENDEVAIHTLASAAYNIFRDLAAKGLLKPVLMKQAALDHIDKKHHKEWLNHMNKFENFFKHADNDHDHQVEFYLGATEFCLWEICGKIIEIEGESSAMVATYISWFMARHGDGILSEESKREMNPELKETMGRYKKMGRKEFFNYCYPLMVAAEEKQDH